MRLSEFDFDLPEELIATRPARPRSSARMLVATPGSITDSTAIALPEFLRPGDRLVLNDTKVLPARLTGLRHRPSKDGAGQAKIEVTLLSPCGDTNGDWTALLKPLRKIRDGERIIFDDGFSAEMIGRDGEGQARLRFAATPDFDTALARVGAMPLPPYIASRRPSDAQDHKDYQTIWARHKGSVAAPTASLHFDDALMAALNAREIGFTHVTLHVGAGTFLPVKTDDVSEHKMHSEWGEITEAAAAEMNATHAAGGRLIPVGTTALRLMESAAQSDRRIAPWTGPTDIFIRPGHVFNGADGLMTNFHLPKSTLVMLVSALMGQARIREIYAHAIAEKYRFFSYGDASLLLPNG
ncbi:MAG: tRNA preQ1(34) S-adenosylmethionine ribosyltransferase-isomerase QueA [Mangrovicoccus sp.]|nr:tRNA preQ1(34) S-adenosylmethionine ribosyltransferase-isomerase QueA [Mangrovicoccus sp.]